MVTLFFLSQYDIQNFYIYKYTTETFTGSYFRFLTVLQLTNYNHISPP